MAKVKKDKKLYLLFLWHMHQPVYKDPFTGAYKLPWVFLHAIKDYSEMLKYYEIFPIKATFNFVPSLLDQLKDYQSTECNDETLSVIKKPVNMLSLNERQYIIPRLFWANENTMIKPLGRYYEIYLKYKNNSSKSLNEKEILDVEVMFLISWTGTFIREESSFIKKLIHKQRDYTEDEKSELIRILHEKIKYIFTQLQNLSNNIEISVTPYFHPILPLLENMESAKEVLPDIELPENRLYLGEDAEWHVEEAVNIYETYFGEKPKGVWPAEGSVSQDILKYFNKAGFTWAATDEDILAKSIGTSFGNIGKKLCLYERHYIEINGKRLFLFFRDKQLSDLIGFKYSSEYPKKAADDFISRLRVIYDSCDFSPLVPVILDGENAWEYYPNNARMFFERLYEELSDKTWLQTSTMSEAVNIKETEEHNLDKIIAGSWIRGDFATWVGHSEKNTAWEKLFDTKTIFNKNKTQLNKKQVSEVDRLLKIAEGSDWFWWYGDDHHTNQQDILDSLFRSHLQAVYKYMNLSIPEDLHKPIHSEEPTGIILPKNTITPVIDGKISDFFEYMGAGYCDMSQDLSSMHMEKGFFKELYWGFDSRYLYLAVFTHQSTQINGTKVALEIQNNKTIKTEFNLNKNDLTVHKPKDLDIDHAYDEILEIKISLSYFFGDTAPIRLSAVKNGNILDLIPTYDFIHLPVKKEYLQEWAI